MFSFSSKESRKTPRVQTHGTDGLLVAFVRRDGALEEGQVLDASALGVGAVFEREAIAGLRVGQRVQLFFYTARDPDTRMCALASVRNDIGLAPGGRVRCGFEFSDLSGFHRHVPPHLFTYFNRRRSFRVVPPKGTTIPVEVRPRTEKDAAALAGELVDVSTTGVGLVFDAALAAAAAALDHVELRFELPGADAASRLLASVVFRACVGPSGRLGLVFDSDANPSNEEERVRAYVMERQREMLNGD